MLVSLQIPKDKDGIFCTDTKKALSLQRIRINIMEESKNKKWTKETAEAFFQKMIDDKKAIVECIKEGGDINKVADERGFEIARTL